MTSARPIVRLLGPRTFWLFAGIIGLVEAIYLAEEFTSLMEFIVANGGTVTDTLFLSLLKTPEIIDFALPIAILISVYFAILGARETNELMVYAAAGVPWSRIPHFAILVGLVGVTISIAFSAVITPSAAYLFRVTAQTLEGTSAIREITEPGHKNAIRSFNGRTFIATPPLVQPANRGNLFVFQPDEGDGWRASQADDWTIVGPRDDGSHAVRLESYRDYVGRSEEQQVALEADIGTVQGTLQTAKWDVENVAVVIRLEELLRPVDLAPQREETILLPLLVAGIVATQLGWEQFDRQVGQIFGRATGCLLAALLAVAAAAWTGSQFARLAGLPLSVAVILGGDVVIRTLLVDAAVQGILPFLQTFAIVLAIIFFVPLAYIYRRREAVIVPRRGQG